MLGVVGVACGFADLASSSALKPAMIPDSIPYVDVSRRHICRAVQGKKSFKFQDCQEQATENAYGYAALNGLVYAT